MNGIMSSRGKIAEKSAKEKPVTLVTGWDIGWVESLQICTPYNSVTSELFRIIHRLFSLMLIKTTA